MRTYLYGIIAGMKVLQNFSNYLALGARILFSHRSVHQLRYIFVKMSNKML